MKNDVMRGSFLEKLIIINFYVKHKKIFRDEI